MRLTAALAALLASALAAAAGPVTPEAFERMSEGRTLHFTLDGRDFGAEQYFPGRRSLWRYADGGCAWGRWYARDGLICFRYDLTDDPQCWRFEGDGGAGFSATLIENGLPSGPLLRLSGADERPLDCPAPGVGS
ncbi:hypothetical protein [Amaricoccus solimangrovi]|uniref:DUF995 domain-containing protein n=1 Tax=Amaricoccus solimangrovi TaxID=2589815 RepID=A0A501WTP1_9RHOB|nr:hypothetical protein [Amaricoccus solimangrovi]TPE51484.1 hypothetical protein FJM51_09625 [Amaricoccus solimangrovi]